MSARWHDSRPPAVLESGGRRGTLALVLFLLSDLSALVLIL